MLNVVLIFALILNLAAGFLLIARMEPIVWGRRGIFIPRKTAIQDAAFFEWDPDRQMLPEDESAPPQEPD